MSDVYAFVFVLGALGLALAALGSRARRAPWGRFPRAVEMGVSLAVLATAALPINGVAIGRWPAAYGYQPSVPFLALILAAAVQKFTGRQWLTTADQTATWTWLALAGTALFPSVLGLGRFDLYALGWRWSPVFLAAAVVTIGLLAAGNRAGLFLLAAVISFALALAGSSNLWDYLVDPLGWIGGLGFLAVQGWRKIRPGKRGGATV